MAGRGGKRAGAGRPKGSDETAPKVRAAFWRAVENLKKSGGIDGLESILEEMITSDPVKAFDVLSKFTPKEVELDVDETKTVYYIGVPDMPETDKEWFKQQESQTVQ